MGYGRTSYRRGYRGQQTAGRVAKANARAGECRSCHEVIPAGGGQLWREGDGLVVGCPCVGRMVRIAGVRPVCRRLPRRHGRG